jgi:hypothetical protein
MMSRASSTDKSECKARLPASCEASPPNGGLDVMTRLGYLLAAAPGVGWPTGLDGLGGDLSEW